MGVHVLKNDVFGVLVHKPVRLKVQPSRPGSGRWRSNGFKSALNLTRPSSFPHFGRSTQISNGCHHYSGPACSTIHTPWYWAGPFGSQFGKPCFSKPFGSVNLPNLSWYQNYICLFFETLFCLCCVWIAGEKQSTREDPYNTFQKNVFSTTPPPSVSNRSFFLAIVLNSDSNPNPFSETWYVHQSLTANVLWDCAHSLSHLPLSFRVFQVLYRNSIIEWWEHFCDPHYTVLVYVTAFDGVYSVSTYHKQLDESNARDSPTEPKPFHGKSSGRRTNESPTTKHKVNRMTSFYSLTAADGKHVATKICWRILFWKAWLRKAEFQRHKPAPVTCFSSTFFR